MIILDIFKVVGYIIFCICVFYVFMTIGGIELSRSRYEDRSELFHEKLREEFGDEFLKIQKHKGITYSLFKENKE